MSFVLSCTDTFGYLTFISTAEFYILLSLMIVIGFLFTVRNHFR